MEIITFISSLGETLVFSSAPDSDYFLRYFDRNSQGSTPHSFVAIGMDGQITQGADLAPRVMNIGATLRPIANGRWNECRAYELVQKFCRVFAPGRPGLLIYRNPVGVYQIACRCNELPVMDKAISYSKQFELQLIADEPYWLSQYEFINRLGQVVGGKQYPLRYPLRFGEWIKNAHIENDTGNDTPVVVEISSTALYILLTNETTGEFLQVDESIGENQKMIIDTDACTVELLTLNDFGEVVSREYANYKLTLASRYFKLKPGFNYITLDNGYPDTTVTAVLRYRKRYAGV